MRSRLRPQALLLLSVAALPWAGGCSDDNLVGTRGEKGAPTAVLRLSVTSGQAPLDVELDASRSKAFLDDGVLAFAFDTDGDGEFDDSEDDVISNTYTSAGTFKPAVLVRGSDGRFDIASAELVVEGANAPRTADVDVDSNNDGSITPDDEAIEDSAAAAFLANVDDDNGDGERDRDTGELDDTDVADIVVRRVTGLGDGKVSISVQPAIARQRTIVWQGAVQLSSDSVDGGQVTSIGDDDVTLRLEARTGRTADWDGRMTITVNVEVDGTIISTDTVKLRAAPVMFPSNLQAPKQLYVLDLPSGPDNNRALLSAFASLPEGVRLNTLEADRYEGDRWVQDNWEVGTQVVPARGGGVKEMITAMQIQRSYGFSTPEGLETFVTNDWLSADRGFFYPAGDETSHNYGGNLEVLPPTEQWPLGRMVYGGGTTALSGRRNVDTMNDAQVSFLDAQEIQGPALEISSEWLAVGHIDEFMQLVPDLTPDEGGHPYKIAIASPALARSILVDLQQAGQGSLAVLEGRDVETTIDDLLADENFAALNEAAQVRIDEQQQAIIEAMGLTDDDFRAVPVMYEEVDSGLVASFNPGIQNLVTVGDRVFAPDPEGPTVDGSDVWQAATVQALADTDLDVIFVDVFESYHVLLGEAHCGTNLEREAPGAAWWTVEQ
jgi:protein-arginine deiminase